mgnify:CR=1 FL=1
MDASVNEITINGKQYVEKGTTAPAQNTDGLQYVIARTYSAGVFAGYLKQRNGTECELLNARRLWYWDGAATLSELSVKGVGKPENCKFPEEVPSVILTETIEILPCSEQAMTSIKDVKIWKSN